MKRDLKLNMEELTDVEAKIGRYIGDLDQIESASSVFLQKLKKQDSVSYESLSNIWESGIMEAEGQLHERLELLKKLMSDYVDEMEGLISPVSRGDMMRVDRNDIWWNLKQIENDLSGLSDICYSIPSSYANYRYCVMDYWLGDEEELRAKEKAEQQRRERNYRKLSNFQDSIRSGMIPQMEERMDDLWKIYNDSIVPFENTDDDYHDRAASYYDTWADIGDHLTDFGRGLWDFGRGVWDAVKDLGDGLLTLGVFIIPGMSIMYDAGILPEWMEERAEGVWKTRDALLSDPWNTLGAIVQGAMDTVDEEGITYGISYVATDVAIEILTEKGLGKLAEGSKGAKNATGMLDDVAGKVDVPSIGTAEGAGGTAAIGESAAIGLDRVEGAIEGSAKLPNYIKLGEELGEKISKDGYKIIDIEDAVTANKDWADMGYNLPPVAENTKVYNVEAGDFKYARVFKEGVNNPKSPFILRADDIEGLSAIEIAEKYALPQVPDRVVYPHIPADTPLEVSIVGPQEIWGTIGGDAQYAIKDTLLDDDWFTDVHPLE